MTEASKRIILIDDDAVFGQIMKQYADRRGISLDFYESLEQLGFVALIDRYDVAILDYDLGTMTGAEIGEYLSAFFEGKPILMVSSSIRNAIPHQAKEGLSLPFLLKTCNYDLILSTALALDADRRSSSPAS